MVTQVLDLVARCYDADDGAVVRDFIRHAFARSEAVVLSFEGVESVPTSFVNAAFVELLDAHEFDFVKRNLKIVRSNQQINDLIRRRMSFEAARRAADGPRAA